MGLAMPIAFAICFFFYIGLAETLRHGVFGMNPSEIESAVRAALLLCALFLLRGDLISVIRRPTHGLYGDSRLNWTLARTLAGLVLGPLLLAVPTAYGIATGQISFQPVPSDILIRATVYEAVLLMIGVELFFREAAVKAFSGHLVAMILASVLAYAIYRLPEGIPAAIMAGGAGFYYLALRLSGVNILAVAVVHALVSVVQNQVIPVSTPGAEIWTYAICFTVAAAAMALTLLSMAGPHRREVQYA